MNNFKFKRVNNKFRWESNFMVLEFSNPSIQGFSDYTNLKDEKDIMYYYYTVKIFKKVIEWDDNDKEIVKWKLVGKRNASDFPSILELKWMLNYQINDNTAINGQKIEYQSGEIRYSKTVATEGFACDDFYEITKIVDDNGEVINYVVYTGVTYDCNGDLNSNGIRTQYVYSKDIIELSKCVSDFIKYSLEGHNKQNENYSESFDIKNNKIYEYLVDENSVNKNKVESIYAIGDNLDITTVIANEENDYHKITILKIEDKNIILNNGDIIDFNSIVYISNNPIDDVLKYNADEIAKEFISILANEEKEEFINSDMDLLLNKYKMAIIDRTWMCRDEHKFNIDYNIGDRVNMVTPIVKNVITIIKSILINGYSRDLTDL